MRPTIVTSPVGAELFHVALEAAPIGMMLVAADGRIAVVNTQLELLFGYGKGELVGAPVEQLVPERLRGRHPAFRAAFVSAPTTRPMGVGRDLHGLRRDGTEVPIEIGLNPLHTPDGVFVLSSVVDVTERRRAVEQFRLAIEASPTGMMMVDDRGRIVLVNAQIEQLFGYTREALIGQSIEMLVPGRLRDRHPGYRAAFFAAPDARPMGAGRDLHGLRADGTEVPIEIGLNPLVTSGGSFVLSSVVDISERKRAEAERERLLDELRGLNRELEARGERLADSLHERELMLQEIHHRVKNNLQIITSVINLQLNQLDDAHGRTALVDCQSRVFAMALIHEQLYESTDYAQVRLSPYVSDLARNVVRAAEAEAGRIALALALEDVLVPVDQAIPCGLIVTELLTNALKHGFPDGRGGTLRVTLRATGPTEIELVVADDGVGISADRAPRPGSLGLQLVHALTEQLGGRVHVAAAPGTSFHVIFPHEPARG